ncbi:MAG TPA: iron-containing alcohol dehydrogenase [Anaerolineaceae bacterium]|nr:iron-containing alcohol dehydrogenase [Anaerolineaceae bacterium]
MNNFRYYNPTTIIFGKGSIAKLDELIYKKEKVMLLYGGGSIKQNGVYDQVIKALGKRKVIEFGGIEANPDYETLMKAVKIVQEKDVDLLLAVGGGSVIDGVKFISLAARFDGNPWHILSKGAAPECTEAIPIGTVLTLPATGSEFNKNSVISRREKKVKFSFASDLVFPEFSILDPETTYSLPIKQVRNGIVDAYVHILEQYMTYPVGANVQDRQAEALLLALIETAPAAMKIDPVSYDARANFMWAASNALNLLIGCGVPQDWATHEIGHEITALYGLDHAETLAAILPWLLWYKRGKKQAKLLQYGQRVFGINAGSEAERVDATIEATVKFFNSLGMPTTLSAYQIKPEEAASMVDRRLTKRKWKAGEHSDITPEDAANILRLSC